MIGTDSGPEEPVLDGVLKRSDGSLRRPRGHWDFIFSFSMTMSRYSDDIDKEDNRAASTEVELSIASPSPLSDHALATTTTTMPDMSWMSPKRRRTTGNLKTLPNGQYTQSEGDGSAPSTPTRSGSSKSDRPSPKQRPLSQGSYPTNMSQGPDGNLFYAYARKGDEVRSRYLLTFASASVANEWWLLIQAHFPDCIRPGPQLFSFKTDDLLEKAWRHPAFEHLKTKWMYISFGEAQSNGLGGAAQGIIPVQDAHGNMMGGSASTVASPELGQARKEVKDMRNDVTRLEEHFEKMMEAMEKNTEGVKELAEKQDQEPGQGSNNSGNGYFDMSELSGHFGRMTDLLTRNMEHMENMSKRQFENEQKLSKALEDVNSKQRADYLDMSQLSSHLDRIQNMMEQSVTERKDSARTSEEKTPTIDFSPLTDRLQKMQEAVEANSALIKNLLEEGSLPESDAPRTPFWASGSNQQQVDLAPLTEHLQKIHGAIEQQSSHMQALVGFASGEGEGGNSPIPGGADQQPHANLAPLGEHLEQIYNAIEEGNKHAKEIADRDKLHSVVDSSSFVRQLEAVQTSTKSSNKILEQILDAQTEAKQALQAHSGRGVDLSPLTKHLEGLDASAKDNAQWLQQLLDAQGALRKAVTQSKPAINFQPLTGHLETHSKHLKDIADTQLAMKDSVNKQMSPTIDLSPLQDQLTQLIEGQNGTREAIEQTNGELDFTPLADHMEAVREAIEGQHHPLLEHLQAIHSATDRNAELFTTVINAQLKDIDFSSLTQRLDDIRVAIQENSADVPRAIDFGPLADHLEAIREATDSNAKQVKAAIEEQRQRDPPSGQASIDFTPLTERLNRIHRSLEKVNNTTREASPGSGDPKFILSALTSHLSKIQSVTEQNANAVKSITNRSKATEDKVKIDTAGFDKRLEATSSQVRELMAGHREMTKVMRELAEAITAQNKGSCDHVVIPPPRKVGRKIVGFVYDAKDGPI
ncbi:hypothetical protein M409DRAFT_53111 [Zasmidium cellare ATCC 36951]|uniref:Uncharacterized protein n=1 Tax=Zasmidium cellare ATCC 36951 TaxID=1080233 RepID=A0A6A6CN09_ZASCE|nr:uncharacterized protein M409DRAFT_53111 [Zasmidium cellare ATCC 36951]KAF2168431.1 hypothetical protein M409DRAFT_53111 [Zasmidium cellare ATCC 36951]